MITTTGASGGRAVSHVRVQGLKLNLANKFSNQAPLDYVAFSFSPLPCSWATYGNGDGDAPFKATILDLDLAHATGIGAHPNPTLNVFVGKATEFIDYSCPHVPPVHMESHAYWNVISAFHGGFSFTIDDWDFGSSSFAHKTYAKTIFPGGGSISELTTFDLRHTPE